MASPFPGAQVHSVDHLTFRKAILARDMYLWGDLHIPACGAHSLHAKLSSYLRWFAWPDKVNTVARDLTITCWTGRLCMFGWVPEVPQQSRRCTFCANNAVGDQRHHVFDCPHFEDIQQHHAGISRRLMML